jgi:dienelactone hydrolase
MKYSSLFLISIAMLGFSHIAYGNSKATAHRSSASIKTEEIIYTSGNVSLHGYVAYDESVKGKRPVVLIVHEWWGLNEYVKRRARQLAELGYLAMAVDMYGDGQVATDPAAAMKLSAPFYKDPQMAKARFDAALDKIKTYNEADTTKIAAIGYCFGGGMVLNFAKLGENLKGVVSFHGSLVGVPADKNLLKAQILVCHGEADQFTKPADVAAFKNQLDSIGAAYTFKSYPGAMHAFTNPDATELGKKFSMPIAYNEAADKASWKDMQDFFKKIFE